MATLATGDAFQDLLGKLQSRKQAEKNQLNPKTFLMHCGWPERCATAKASNVTPLIAALAPLELFPQTSFGLIGPTGCGKTFAIASAAKKYAAQSPRPMECLYINWPAVSLRLRSMAVDGNLKSSGSLLRMQNAERAAYVLDDIGAERGKEGGFAQEQLEVAIDAAYHNCLSVFWSSNLGFAQLEQKYGKRFVSRLLGLAPVRVLPDTLEDRRRNAS